MAFYKINIFEILQYAFIQKAILAGTFIAICCAFLGVFLVLRRLSLIGDGLAHVSFATVALGLLLGASPVYVSIPLVMLASIWILRLAEKTAMYGDSAIGLVSSLGIAIAVLIASIAGGFNVDLFSYLFGSILSISTTEVIFSIILSLAVISIIILLYHDLFSITFDEEFAKAGGIKVELINKILILLTAVTIVLGIRVVGTMLISSLIIFPSVSALQVSKGFKSTIINASLFGIVSVISGTFLSFYLNLPTGATIVIMNFIIFIFSFFTGKYIIKKGI